MKTSNKIIVSFLTFAWVSIMASLLVSHQFADYGNIPGMRRVTTKTDPLDEFSAIKIEQAARLKIVQGDSNQLHYEELTGDGITPPEIEAIQDYSVRNDTLFIKNLRQGSNGGFKLEVSNLKHLMVYNTWEVDLGDFRQDSLVITYGNSKVLMSKKSELSYLHILSPQKFDLSLTSVKELDLILSGELCELSGSVNQISGIVGNYAELILPTKVGKMDIDTSENGKLTLK
ncbi:hypothetical protein SYJ56_22095 [Algoriphagus sp. D3-2-R+10]|uniref:hypothetical protein n=1 Tax=Algoriphagus aurantiacus TaxID=3103948 RepID=UPI002B396FE2|nr:hypothetical protein [Algoriphagus sp. D3-2-R+10]MEB2778021.1 hypothetical protein [Algoriphagus sp. D3-2-R+10]